MGGWLAVEEKRMGDVDATRERRGLSFQELRDPSHGANN